jgi:Ca-activated chloride channel family protein
MNGYLEGLTGIRLAEPRWLLLVALLPLVLWLRHRRGRAALLFAPARFAHELPRSWRHGLHAISRALPLLGWALLLLALARPVQRTALPREAEGIDILMCLDVSSSMAYQDMDRERTRLDVAKAAAAEFLQGRAQDRFGLLCFARYPDVICPLTLHQPALLQLLENVEMVEAFSREDVTGIGNAVARCAQILAASAAKSKVVILLTDGEENVATAQSSGEIGPLQAAQLCTELGVRVYTIAAGIGRRDSSGNWVAIETGSVEKLATQTGGVFLQAQDAAAIADVYRTIDELETVQFAEPRTAIHERFRPFVLAALALLLAERLLQAFVLRVMP